MRRLEVKPGDVFGHFTVIGERPRRSRHRTMAVRAACGARSVMWLSQLVEHVRLGLVGCRLCAKKAKSFGWGLARGVD